jgi:asparagine synthase (glutamine-hydrolysing)
MCGIWAAIKRSGNNLTPEVIYALVSALLPRGPEYLAVQDVSGTLVTLGFTRLAINGLTPAGHQPFSQDDIHVVCNGEIYNYKELAARWSIDLPPGTSDCAVLPHLLRKLPLKEVCKALDGVFAFVAVDTRLQKVYVARDPYGVRPLFAAKSANGRFFSSEMKGLPANCFVVEAFPPGTCASYSFDDELLEIQVHHTIPTVKVPLFEDRLAAQAALRVALEAAVKKRLLSDRPIGSLLSGGLDSSLIAALAAKELATQGKKLNTFSIGMPGSTDLYYAKKVADHIGSNHHEILVKPGDFLAAIPVVIDAAETYDITSVRASVGNYLVGNYIKENTDIKVVFNGDGSDEVGGGYLYFYAAPSDEEFEAESERLLKEIHVYDVLRSDRGMAAHGLEARTPFLDKAFVATWRALPTRFRRPFKGSQVEKQILREAFEGSGLLPHEVLWRKKEAFSDGVSSTADSWYLRCANYAKTLGKTIEMIREETAALHNPPQTEEAYWYRMLFQKIYGEQAARVIPAMWMPRWIAGAHDPSARTLKELY